jgi:hypothetical protein
MIKTDFYEVGFKSVDSLKEIDFENKYLVYGVTFGDGNRGLLLYPYQIKTSSNGIVISTGTDTKLKLPAINEQGEKGFRQRSIGFSSDIPQWVKQDIKTVLKNNESLCSKFKGKHNLSSVEFYF